MIKNETGFEKIDLPAGSTAFKDFDTLVHFDFSKFQEQQIRLPVQNKTNFGRN